MKKTKKRWQGISLSGVILVCTFLAACGGEAQETVTETVDEAEGETTAVTGDLSIANDFWYETAREAAFLKAVDTLETTGILPDGRYCYVGNPENFNEDKKKAYPNKSAIYDVDEDGKEELILGVEGTCMADMADYVYGYSETDDTFYLEYDGVFGCSFYEGGIVCTPVSHSVFMYDDGFWPYEIYRYNPQKKKYEYYACAEEIVAGQLEGYEEIFTEYDKDGDGKVYFTDVEGEGCYMDEQQYTKWRETILQGEKINIY